MKPSVVFFGGGPVARASLEQLQSSFIVEAIVTKTTTAFEMKNSFSTTPVYTADKKADVEAVIAAQNFTSPVGLIIDYGVIVTQAAIDSFPKGIINSHFSLLPQWRGADPITFAILSGQPQTGVSIMLLTAGLDEGPLLAQAIYDIDPHMTTRELTTALIMLSSGLLGRVVPQYLLGSLEPKPQLESTILHGLKPTFSRKLTKEDGRINWDKPAAAIEREIRAFQPWPKSYTELAGREVIIHAATVVDTEPAAPGIVIRRGKQLIIACSRQALNIVTLQPAGKKVMSTEAFLAGYGNALA